MGGGEYEKSPYTERGKGVVICVHGCKEPHT